MNALSQLSLCPSLSFLYLGNCSQLTDTALHALADKLTSLRVVDLRGCRGISADGVVALLRASPHVHTLSLAHVPMVTDAVLERIAQTLLALHVLDLSGCIKVTSAGVQNLARHPIHALDLACTAISFRGCCAIANYLCTTLQQVSLNFCSDVNDECVKKLLQKCKVLTRISVFGCSYVRNFEMFKKINRNVVIES